MKNIVLLALLCLIASTSFAVDGGDKVLGVWTTADKVVKIQIYRAGNRYFGKVLWGKLLYESDGKTSLKDIENLDANLRNRDCIGLVFITDETYSDDGYSGGQIYDSSHGTTYKLKMKLLDDDNLKMRGYMGMSLFG